MDVKDLLSTDFCPQDASRTARSLFDCALSEDPVAGILGSVSIRPGSLQPQLYVNPRDVLAFLDTSHPLRAEALKQFRSLSVVEIIEDELYR